MKVVLYDNHKSPNFGQKNGVKIGKIVEVNRLRGIGDPIFIHTRSKSGDIIALKNGMFAVGRANIAGAGRGVVFNTLQDLLDCVKKAFE